VTDALANVRGGERACFFQMPTVEISSTMIRQRAAAGRPIKYLVPEGVEAYITRHRLYQGGAST
jgi:nicotinate-nucleotide adenylyltransferase